METTTMMPVTQWLELLIPEIREELVAHAYNQNVQDSPARSLTDAINWINWARAEDVGTLINPLPKSIASIYSSISRLGNESPFYYNEKSIKSVVYDED